MIFVSTMIYALGKVLGLEPALEEFHAQLKNPSKATLPCVRAIQRLQTMDDVSLLVDPAATSIAKARSRAFHAAALSPADVWVMIDDDCEATADTLDSLVQAARASGDLVVAPCQLRGQDRTNVVMYQIESERRLPDGAELGRAHAGGLAIAALSRHAMNKLAEAYEPELLYTDHDQVARLALFAEELAGGQWFGEDIAFCARCTAVGLKVEALLTGVTSHDGRALLLNEVKSRQGLEDMVDTATVFKRRPYTAPRIVREG
jgi:hypothetical protein